MTEKHYEYDHINGVLRGAVEVIKVGEVNGLTRVKYEVLAIAPHKRYEVSIVISCSDYHEVEINEIGDCFPNRKGTKNNTTWPILITVVRIIPGDGAALMQAFGFCARCVHNS